jgi:hypothetical protein
LQSKEYFKFVISKVENEINIYEGSKELNNALYILRVLKNSNNLLRDIYLISRIKNLKKFGNYLLFVHKKVESGEIRFENLLDNLSSDKESIENQLIDYFQIDKPSSRGIADEKGITLGTGKELNETDYPFKGKKLIEKTFKIEEIDEELITEEFNEAESKEDSEVISGKNYLELVQKEKLDEDKTVFNLPGKEEELETAETNEDVYNLPSGEEKLLSNDSEPIETTQRQNEEIETNDIDKETRRLSEAFIPAEEIEKELFKDENKAVDSKDAEKTKITEEQQTEKEVEQISEIKEEEIPVPEEINIPAEIPDEVKQEVDIPVENIRETKTGDDMKQEEEEKLKAEVIEPYTQEEITAEKEYEEEKDISNSVYMKYEYELFERNSRIKSDFDKLLMNIFDEDIEKKHTIIQGIVENSGFMEEYSREMSFEIITGIYSAMKLAFTNANETDGLVLDEDNIVLFRDAIKLIEGLIKGDEIQELNKTIKAIEEIKNTITENKKKKEDLERIALQKKHIEEHLIEKFTDVSQRQKLIVMKEKILEIEDIFKTLETIKGKYQAYEALRTLSHTFNYLKDIAKIANSLEMKKLSQLTEASYIFIKFVQNYRMDPQDNEIKDILKYIIYNFKLIFLDKPTKDIDIFISYLNNPVKIFENKKD